MKTKNYQAARVELIQLLQQTPGLNQEQIEAIMIGAEKMASGLISDAHTSMTEALDVIQLTGPTRPQK